MSVLCLCLVLQVLSLACRQTSAFTTTTNNRRRALDNKGFCLGPVARNGLAYEDIKLGEGRRILPGDTVYCYYQGYFTKKAEGIFGKTTKTVFDEISTCDTSSFVMVQFVEGLFDKNLVLSHYYCTLFDVSSQPKVNL